MSALAVSRQFGAALTSTTFVDGSSSFLPTASQVFGLTKFFRFLLVGTLRDCLVIPIPALAKLRHVQIFSLEHPGRPNLVVNPNVVCAG